MADCTVFELTLPNGKQQAVGFPRDFVDENDLKVGESVRILPRDGSFTVTFDIVPLFESLVECRIMSMNKQVVCAPMWNNVPKEVWFLYLASSDVTCRYH